MDKICLIAKEYNKCPYFDKEKRCLAESTTCSMLIKLGDNKGKEDVGYQRQPRWYEQYSK